METDRTITLSERALLLVAIMLHMLKDELFDSTDPEVREKAGELRKALAPHLEELLKGRIEDLI